MGNGSRTVLLFLIGALAGVLCTTVCLYAPNPGVPSSTINQQQLLPTRYVSNASCDCLGHKKGSHSIHTDDDSEEEGASGAPAPPQFGANAVHATPATLGVASSLCPASHFTIYEGVDYNQGPDFDLDALHRNGAGASRFPPKVFSHACSAADYNVLRHVRVKNDGLESKHYFLARCMTKCLSLTACTGFVVRGDVCYLKKLMPFMASTREAELVSFVRSPQASSRDGNAVPAHTDANNSAVDTYRPTTYDPLFRSRVMFGVLGNAAQAHERLFPALRTWLCNWDAMVLLEDNPVARALVARLFNNTSSEASLQTHDVPQQCLVGKEFVFEHEPEDSKVRSFNGAWKNMPLLRMMVETHGRGAGGTTESAPRRRDWFCIVDDDTFLLSHNFNIFFNSVVEKIYQPQVDAISVGVVFTDGKHSFIQGGAGIFLSSEAVHRIAANYSWCLSQCITWAGDIRLGCCYPFANVRMVSFPVFFSIDIVKIQREDSSGHSPAALIPVSFHQLKTRSFITAAYNAEQIALGRPPVRETINRRSGAAVVQCIPSDESVLTTSQAPLHCADPFVRLYRHANNASDASDFDKGSSGPSTTSAPPPPAGSSHGRVLIDSLHCSHNVSSTSFVSWHAFSLTLDIFGCA